ncbi:hypothetical protein IFM89_003869 [Coptis chinensis]|uniref:HMG box domain-containing protein n=1 Tax=Coptis chinensis TaxID=261450 RepID=A0A835HZJ6_9MAGN|nr:hypothetical protein IFM89_003869 [Coptis chinensis]
MGKTKASNAKKADNKLAIKRKAGGSERGGKKPTGKAVKDPNKPKRPASAFFVFMEDFRKSFKEKHPNNKSVSVEKAPFHAKAEKRKTEYNKNLQAYNKKLAEGNDAEDEEESDKSKSEVNDEDEDDEEGSDEEDDDE